MKLLKNATAILLAAAMTASMGACSSGGAASQSQAQQPAGASSDAAPASSAAAKEVKTYSLLMYTDWYKSGWQALEKHINDNADTLGFKLDISKIQGGQQGDQILQTKFATNDLPDMIQVYKPQWVESFANSLDKLVDLSGISSAAEYDESALNGTFQYKDKLYSMPIDSITLSGVFYNKKVFEAAGVEVPKTWDEFLAVCEKIKAKNITPVFYSCKDVWSAQPFALTGFVTDAVAAGKDTFGLIDGINTHKTTFSQCTNLIDTFERSKQLIDLGYVNETYLSDTVDNAHQALADGTCAMYVNGTWCADNINQKFPDKIDDIGAFALPMPSGDNYICMFTPYSLSVTTQCSDPEGAKAAVNYIASAEAQQIYADAQPGLYLNKKITNTITNATGDLKAIMDSGKSMTDWEEIISYSYGNLGEHVLNYYTGTFQSAADIAKAMDDETERNAKAKGDPNW